MLAEYSSSIKPEHERAEDVLGLQNLSTKQAPSEYVLGLIPILMSFCWVLILLFVFDLENIWIVS